ncbi:SDR family oxidoreductase [Microbacterium aurantiacum]|uniref:SDR family oxidoreductase n=1 Tax=Microbacterium aurantiacum TaxID=162393 RepID=A0ABT8FWB5_9MICO|nr:SDR family oxidoreductase [Microbacterium aurantiacum]MDN4465387.1 SDR family oxidoreductase [Microbacterium aurantiacum]
MIEEERIVESTTLAGKVAIVTGGGGGIGEVYARTLAEAGAAVAVADIRLESATAAAERLASDGLNVIAVEVDIASTQSAIEMASRVERDLGRIDILVNNAALMSELAHTSIAEIPINEFLRIQDINVAGALRCSQAVLPAMRERQYGKIINQSSGAAFIGGGAYGISKLGIVGLTAGLAKAVSGDGIRVNAIAPGAVRTAAGLISTGSHMETIEKTVPFGSGAPESLAGALLFLASSASDWVTGQTLNVDGGWIIRL